MARFFGEMWGQSPKAVTRQGHNRLSGHLRGHKLGAEVVLFINDNGDDQLTVRITGGSDNPTGEIIFQDSHGNEQVLQVGEEVHFILPIVSKVQLDTELYENKPKEE